MTNTDKQAAELNRKKTSLKNMYFNRFLGIRYLTALFFFFNMYWMIMMYVGGSVLALIPLAIVFVFIPVAVEQVKLYSHHKNLVPWTEKYYWIQIVTNITLLLTLFTPLYQTLFPFMSNSIDGKSLLLGILLLGTLLGLWAESRLRKIKNDKDRHYNRLQQYKKSLYL